MKTKNANEATTVTLPINAITYVVFTKNSRGGVTLAPKFFHTRIATLLRYPVASAM